MKKIETLTSIEGRRFLYDTFKRLTFENQVSGLAALVICWKICVYEKDVSKFIKTDRTILHSLGFWKGTSLWLEEIVNRHYFSTINSLVYLGAAIILILIGIRRFSDAVSEELVIAGIIFEALMLVLIFVVMLFTPKEDIFEEKELESEESLLVSEIGEISTDFATAVNKLENINLDLKNINNTQQEILTNLVTAVEGISKAVSPNDEFIKNIKQTNEQITSLKEKINELTKSAESIRKTEVRFEIRKEIEKMLAEKIKKDEKGKTEL